MLERMVAYGQSGRCRWKVLLENFDEGKRRSRAAARCDNCVRIHGGAEGDARRCRLPRLRRSSRRSRRPMSSRKAKPLRVPRYGQGVVERADGEGVTVVFAEGSRRVFLPAFVRRAPAAKPRRVRSERVASGAL